MTKLIITQNTKNTILKTATYLALVDMFKNLDNPIIIQGKVETVKNPPVCGFCEVLVNWNSTVDLRTLGFDVDSFHASADVAHYIRANVSIDVVIERTLENVYMRNKKFNGGLVRKLIHDLETAYRFHETAKKQIESIESDLYLYLGNQGAVPEEKFAQQTN